MALRTSKLSKNCASRDLVGPFRRAARAEKGPPGLQGGGGGRPRRPPILATCLLRRPSLALRVSSKGLKGPFLGLSGPSLGPRSPSFVLSGPFLGLKRPSLGVREPSMFKRTIKLGLKGLL